MDLQTRIKLMLSRGISKNSSKIIQAILSTTDGGTYAVPGYTLIVTKRSELSKPLRGVFRNADSPYGFVIGPQSITMMDQNHTEAVEILKFLVEWNNHAKEKHGEAFKRR